MKRKHKTSNTHKTTYIFVRDVSYIIPKINFLYGLQ
jgi:hypothetical protein